VLSRPARSGIGVLAVAVAAGAFAAGLAALDAAGFPAELLTPDPNSVAGQPAYVGLLSTLGMMLWGAASAACFLSAAAVRRAGRRTRVEFLVATGALCLVAGIDDAALFHEIVAPRLGVPQIAVLALYAAVGTGWLLRFRGVLRASGSVLPAVAIGSFAAMVLVDQLELSRLIEDYFKFVGMAALLAFVATEALRTLGELAGHRAAAARASPGDSAGRAAGR
jgi:hypothetical protein